MASDPRRAGARSNGDVDPLTSAVPKKKNNILLGGEDDVDVDEDIPISNKVVGGAPSVVEGKEAGVSRHLLDQIITPSPYPQHNSGPTSSRFRNALNRVLQQPDTDVEAWQALLTEVHSCYKNIANVHSVDADTQTKLDWVESCYGHFLRYFPYAHTHAVTVVEMLMKQSARWGEPDGPHVDYFGTRRAQMCEDKLEGLLVEWLGISSMKGEAAPMWIQTQDESSAATRQHLTGICSWVVELWLLYVKKRARDATRVAEKTIVEVGLRAAHVRDATKQAFEVALPHCGFSHNNQLIWVAYLDFVKSWTAAPGLTPNTAEQLAATQQQMVQQRSVYQRLVTHPMTGLDQLWHEYEAWERNHSEALAQALSTEFAPKYQHARTVYLERNRVYNAKEELQLGQRLAVPPADPGEEDYASKVEEEHRLLTAWKKRCSYERTNPERLSPQDLAIRIRAAYKEMACVMTRHPETWHMWSSYELFRNGSASPSPLEARGVLRLGQELIPDSTLLVYAEAHIVELYTMNRQESMEVMQRCLKRFPTTLGFVLYQQMVRRYKGMDSARAVFGRARRVLRDADSTSADNADPSAKEQIDEPSAEKGESIANAHLGGEDDKVKRWTVTNRLGPLVGSRGTNGSREAAAPATGEPRNRDNTSTPDEEGQVVSAGVITWHLFAAHASMEHRINRCPEIAARIYELGLRKHSSFLTKAAYVIRYAELLLELGDTMNLRALLTRAVSACEAAKGKNYSSLASLWDMTLRFETIVSGADPDSLANLEVIERQRRQAIMGAEMEDVATGAFVGVVETPLIGAQKSSISEHLIRTEGYDISSGIVNGMGRTVDVLEVMGLWGSGEHDQSRRRMQLAGDSSIMGNGDDMPGGESDASYQRRLGFSNAGAGGPADGTGDAVGGSRLLTARERLQQAASAAGPAGPTSAIMLAIQQMPDWLRPLLLLLPASRLRLPIVAKPPPHLTEIALTTLKQNPLPAERPSDGSGNKRRMGGGGDSSDDDNGGKSSGYGIAFRARQRARMHADGAT